MAHDVFVSYSSKDKPAADAACAVLESSGIRCWIAPRDILPGRDWGEAIIGAINGCKLMVLIFSSRANESQQIKREVERVVNRGLPIIPVRIEEVLPAQALEYFLSTPHWMDAFTPPLEQHLEQLAVIVREILNQTSRPAQSRCATFSQVMVAICQTVGHGGRSRHGIDPAGNYRLAQPGRRHGPGCRHGAGDRGVNPG